MNVICCDRQSKFHPVLRTSRKLSHGHNFELISRLNFFSSNSTQWWKDVELGPPDIILGIFEAYKVDRNPNKIDLSVGAYRDTLGKPYVLTSVLKAEQSIVDQKQDKQGDSDIGSEYFREETFRLAVGDKLFNRPHVSAQVSVSLFSSSTLYVFFPVPTFTRRKLMKFTAKEEGNEIEY